MEKQLTIIVPAYNAAQYLHKCLGSMVEYVDERLEVIVVDDGSTDDTALIAKGYADNFPATIKLISKQNGGHGSVINFAVGMAKGRYFKVVDADDWIVSENLKLLLDRLECSSADAIITGYRTVDMTTGKMRAFSSECEYTDRPINMRELLVAYDTIFPCCSFHGLFYRTEMYRDANIQLSEGIFYEDQEYSTLPMAHVKTLEILPFFFYEYLVGNSNQSVSFQNQVKRIGNIKQVIKVILDYRKAQSPLLPEVEEYFMRRLAIVTVSYFAVALIKNPDKRQGRIQASEFYQELEREAPELLTRIHRKYVTLKFFDRIHFSPNLYQRLLETDFYKQFRRIWNN